MAKSKFVDLLGLSEFKEKIVDLFSSHTSNSNIHMSQEDRNNIIAVTETLGKINDATKNANDAASYANFIGDELATKLENGDFNGKDGVIYTSTGQFSFKIVGDDLFQVYPDGDTPRDFKINENGDLILTYGD